jgi:hypothetical protein
MMTWLNSESDLAGAKWSLRAHDCGFWLFGFVCGGQGVCISFPLQAIPLLSPGGGDGACLLTQSSLWHGPLNTQHLYFEQGECCWNLLHQWSGRCRSQIALISGMSYFRNGDITCPHRQWLHTSERLGLDWFSCVVKMQIWRLLRPWDLFCSMTTLRFVDLSIRASDVNMVEVESAQMNYSC